MEIDKKVSLIINIVLKNELRYLQKPSIYISKYTPGNHFWLGVPDYNEIYQKVRDLSIYILFLREPYLFPRLPSMFSRPMTPPPNPLLFKPDFSCKLHTCLFNSLLDTSITQGLCELEFAKHQTMQVWDIDNLSSLTFHCQKKNQLPQGALHRTIY